MPDLNYTYDPRSRRYRSASSGQYVTASEVRQAVDVVIDGETVKIRDISQRLIDGEITLADWQMQTAHLLKTLHVAMGVAAVGGFAQASQADYGYMGSLIKKQYQFLNKFAQDIASGKQALDGTLLSRSALYTQAGRGTFSDTVSYTAENGGMTECRRILGGNDHCSGCLEEVARGWVPISEALPIGGAECRSNCRCEQEFR